ncbi:MAG: ClpXP protease specificity-enhancing factor [Gammaproteobacteria bacterium]|nr:ClpXP protease specificity-enhancing factor [Gammaproteobacteria bacterium]
MSTTLKPYLIRAIYQWAVDEGFTPHILVDATISGTQVPKDYVKDGQVVLNVHPQSAVGLDMGNDSLAFSARFSGREFSLFIPMNAVLAVFAKENGQGMTFAESTSHEPPPAKQPVPETDNTNRDGKQNAKRPTLKIIK